MSKKHRFTAVIQNAGGGGAYVEIPFDVEKEFGSKRPKVKAEIESIPYRGTLMRMGSATHMLGILKSIREQCGKDFGDEVHVTLEADTEERVVEVPAELQQALKKEKTAQSYFDSLSYTHKREFVNYILEAKKDETRARRVEKVVEMLRQGKKGI
ncbi:MAG TPA: YdeI/OmpD-associated family protein [Anaerolineales bacterium]